MSDIQVLLFCCLISFITICIVYYMNKQTTANLYRMTVEPDAQYPKSPYSVSREQSNGSWGYCINKNGSVLYSNNKSKMFDSVEEALYEINKLENIQGYQITKLR